MNGTQEKLKLEYVQNVNQPGGINQKYSKRERYLAAKKKHNLKYKDYYKAYKKEWSIKNRKKVNESSTKWRNLNPEKRKLVCSKYLSTHKIERKLTLLLTTAKQRCNNPKFKGYKYYGGRGVRCLLTSEDVKFLWDRDNGKNQKKASLDRINPDYHYTIENCRIIELSENSKNNRPWQFVKFGYPIIAEK